MRRGIAVRQVRSSILWAVAVVLATSAHVPAQPAPAQPPSRQALIDWVGGSRSEAFLDGGDDDEQPSANLRRSLRSGRRAGSRSGATAGARTGRAGKRSGKPADDFSVDEL